MVIGRNLSMTEFFPGHQKKFEERGGGGEKGLGKNAIWIEIWNDVLTADYNGKRTEAEKIQGRGGGKSEKKIENCCLGENGGKHQVGIKMVCA